MESQAAVFQNAEITAIKARDGDYYHTGSYALGLVQGSTLFAAVSRTDSRQVVLIPYHAVLAIEVSYEHEQAAVQDTVAA